MKNRQLLSPFFWLLVLAAAIPAFATIPPSLAIEASSRKVPKQNAQMDIFFSSRTTSEIEMEVMFLVDGSPADVLQITPSGSVLMGQNGAEGSARLSFPSDGYYKVTAMVFTPDWGDVEETHLYFRMDQGNIHTIPEQIYKDAVQDLFVADTRSKATEHARRHLDELQANGLQIAVENWPHEDIEFPVENDFNIPIQTQEEIYASEFISTALQDPSYSGGIISIPPTKKYPCYFAKISNSANLALYENKHARISFSAEVVGYGGDILSTGGGPSEPKHVPIPDVFFRVYSQIYVTDLCNGFTTLKTVYYTFTTDTQGRAVVDIAYASFVPVFRVIGFTRNERVQVSECTTGVSAADGSPAPLWDPEGVKEELNDWCIVSTGGCTADDQIIEAMIRIGEDGTELWDVQATYRMKDARLLHPNNFIVFDHLRKISNFLYVRGFGEDKSSFNACEWDDIGVSGIGTAACWPRDHGIPFVTIAYKSKDQMWPFANPIAHESGHALQFNMQGGWQYQWAAHHDFCQVIPPGAAFMEGFAHWFANYTAHSFGKALVSISHFAYANGNKASNEVYNKAKCNENLPCYTVDKDYSRAYKEEVNVADILWDLFDYVTITDNLLDPECDIDERPIEIFPVPSGVIPPQIPSYNDSLGVQFQNLKDHWNQTGYESIQDFFKQWKAQGKPLNGLGAQADELLNLHYVHAIGQ